jgi:hypothetical protein
MVAWMNSPEHRDNILEPEYDEVGIGVVPGTPGDTSWGATYTTDFGAVVRDTTSDAVAGAASAGKPRKASAKAAKRCKTGTVRVRAASVKTSRGTKTKRIATCTPPRKTTARKGR